MYVTFSSLSLSPEHQRAFASAGSMTLCLFLISPILQFLDPPGTFGESIVEEFLKANNLVGIVRASQAWPSTQSPFLYKNRLATVWAAPMHKDTKARGLALLFRENEKQADGFTDDQIHDLNKEQR